jgi:hypothetical protein
MAVPLSLLGIASVDTLREPILFSAIGYAVFQSAQPSMAPGDHLFDGGLVDCALCERSDWVPRQFELTSRPNSPAVLPLASSAPAPPDLLSQGFGSWRARSSQRERPR